MMYAGNCSQIYSMAACYQTVNSSYSSGLNTSSSVGRARSLVHRLVAECPKGGKLHNCMKHGQAREFIKSPVGIPHSLTTQATHNTFSHNHALQSAATAHKRDTKTLEQAIIIKREPPWASQISHRSMDIKKVRATPPLVTCEALARPPNATT